MVIWIVGMSGTGKSFLAKKLSGKLKKRKIKVCWVDGDNFRRKFSKDLGYSISDRRKNSKRIQKYCKEMERKKFLVICSILSIFKDHQKENRKVFKKYIQVFLKTEKKILLKRNNKKVYSNKKNVVGKDIKFLKPYKSHFTLTNKFDKNFLTDIEKIEKRIYENL